MNSKLEGNMYSYVNNIQNLKKYIINKVKYNINHVYGLEGCNAEK